MLKKLPKFPKVAQKTASCTKVAEQLVDRAKAIETHSITLKTWPYLGQNFTIPLVPIRLRDLAENNDVEFSIRMILTRF